MIILNNTIENLSALVELLASIGNVVQVRANEVLREAVKAKLAELESKNSEERDRALAKLDSEIDYWKFG